MTVNPGQATRYAVAPPAPGGLGQDVPPDQLMRYLDALGQWRDRRKAELDTLDRAALDSPDGAALTGDVLLSMTLWKSVADRHDLLLAAWDSGRLDEAGRRRVVTLIWGRMEQSGGTRTGTEQMAVTLPEACRLSDALAGSLRARLRLDGAEPDLANRLQDLRQQVERIRDQVALIPAAHRDSAQATLTELDGRLTDVTDRARRGADVGGLVPPLEVAAATAERDLIVAASARDRARGDHERARRRRDQLQAEGQAVRALAEQVRAAVTPAPRLGIPDVTALGDVPTEPAALSSYLERLTLVGKALEQARGAYGSAQEARRELDERARRLAASLPAAQQRVREDVGPLAERAVATLTAVPADLDHVRALLAAVEAYLHAAGSSQGGTGRSGQEAR